MQVSTLFLWCVTQSPIHAYQLVYQFTATWSWSLPVLVVMIIFALATWLLYGKSHYAGPIKSLTVWTTGGEVEMPKKMARILVPDVVETVNPILPDKNQSSVLLIRGHPEQTSIAINSTCSVPGTYVSYTSEGSMWCDTNPQSQHILEWWFCMQMMWWFCMRMMWWFWMTAFSGRIVCWFNLWLNQQIAVYQVCEHQPNSQNLSNGLKTATCGFRAQAAICRALPRAWHKCGFSIYISVQTSGFSHSDVLVAPCKPMWWLSQAGLCFVLH